MVIAMTKPMSVVKPKRPSMAIAIGLPPVDVKTRAKTTSTQENMKQKKQATPTPGAITGIRNLTKKAGLE